VAATLNAARRAIAVLALVIVLAMLAPGAAAQPGERSYFGVVGAAAGHDAAHDLAVGWQQIAFDWAAFQPEGPAAFETDGVDLALLRDAADAGREVVGLIIHTPAWASPSGQPNAVPTGLDLPVDDPANIWAAFVARLARAYAPRGVHRWVIYDEPDVRLGEGTVQFAGGVEEYARLLRAASQAAKAADPRALIHVAAMRWWSDAAAGREPYLARLIRALESSRGTADSATDFDMVMVRVTDETQAIWDVLAANRAILDAAGLANKPIWLVAGASPTLDSQDPLPDPLFGLTLAQQSDFIVQAAAIGLVAGAQRFAVYRLNDALGDPLSWGLERAGGSRRPAFDTYRALIALFAPTISATRYANESADLVVLDQEERDVYVMWARGDRPVQFVVTSGQVGEQASLDVPPGAALAVASQAAEWPAAFTLDAPAARRDDNGFLTVAGSPRILVLDRTDFFRVVYADVNGERFRLK
jgi:hypothetical protein